ncbi:heat shock 70 kDa protein 12A-like [Sinocyclocheilus grahami]|uniref:heat shock 70 kDa protein 12A-like n=1 Tax=Sinocyclocheilus grahami TaxID=75366 RepID=UPI0007ACBC0F|nr:PREDICTED: heat shock 70 kDa protein 12A-like [Sinocyclocheilus grahami]
MCLWRLNPPRPITVPTWDLPTVLRALKSPPFEPLQSIDLRPLVLKTALLLALASVKHMAHLQALSVSPTCLEFGPNDSKVVLKPRHGVTRIGRDDAPEPQDITIEGPGIEAEHCRIENRGGVVTLDPCRHLCSLDGVPVTRPTQLTQGGTIDITVHEVVEEGHLKELHAASGNDMGGQRLKCDIANLKSYDTDVTVWCPLNLKEIASQRQSMECYFEGVRGVKWEDGAIMIEKQQLRRFLDNSLRAIEDNIKQIVKNTELRIEYMLLVGGYSQSPTLLEFMKKHFGSRHKILCPDEPQVAILKGAITYGKNPTVVKSRISTLTYGFATSITFNESVHKGKSKYVNSLGDEYCDVVFEQLVSKGESVLCDELRVFTRWPADPTQTAMRFRFYSTKRQNVKFVDDWGVECIASLSVGMPNTDKGMSRKVRLEVQFGSTEMKATATDLESVETKSVKFDFMSK